MSHSLGSTLIVLLPPRRLQLQKLMMSSSFGCNDVPLAKKWFPPNLAEYEISGPSFCAENKRY